MKLIFFKQSKYIILSLLFISFFSCKSDNKRIEYFENGKVKYEVETKNGLKWGKSILYYPNEQIKTINYWENDTLHGLTEHYYYNGKLKSREYAVKGQKDGLAVEFYKNGKIRNLKYFSLGRPIGDHLSFYDTGKLSLVNSFIVRRGVSGVNQYISYDRGGNLLLNESHYITINLEKDTVEMGELYNAVIKLEAPFYKDMKVVIGNFDEQFSLKSKNSLDTLYGNNYKVVLKKQANKVGENIIRGFVDDYIIDNSKGYPSEIGHEIYFEIYYWVKNPIPKSNANQPANVRSL